jgi:hypothetical protein
MQGESALVNKGFGFTFWTDKEGHDDLQAAWEKAYGKFVVKPSISPALLSSYQSHRI